MDITHKNNHVFLKSIDTIIKVFYYFKRKVVFYESGSNHEA